MAEASIGEYNLGESNSNTSTSNSSGGNIQPQEPPVSAPFGKNNTVISQQLPSVSPSPVSDSTNVTPRKAGIDKNTLKVSSQDLRFDSEVIRVQPDAPAILPLDGFELQNKYVSEDYYTSTNTISGQDDFYEITEKSLKNKIGQDSDIEVSGRYPENREYFPKFSLSNITPRPDVNFNFIIKTVNEKEVKLFTSKRFYDYLVDSYSRNLPYPTLANFPSVVTIDLKPILDNVKSFYNKEQKVGVRVSSNVCVDITRDDNDVRTYTINYDKLLRYLNWMLSKPSANYEERILPPQEISSYQLDGEFDNDTNTGLTQAQTDVVNEAVSNFLNAVFGGGNSTTTSTTTSTTASTGNTGGLTPPSFIGGV